MKISNPQGAKRLDNARNQPSLLQDNYMYPGVRFFKELTGVKRPKYMRTKRKERGENGAPGSAETTRKRLQQWYDDTASRNATTSPRQPRSYEQYSKLTPKGFPESRVALKFPKEIYSPEHTQPKRPTENQKQNRTRYANYSRYRENGIHTNAMIIKDHQVNHHQCRHCVNLPFPSEDFVNV